MIPDAELVTSPRKVYYNPLLDPATQLSKMTRTMRGAVNDGSYNDGSVKLSGSLEAPDPQHPANLISSLCEDGLHRPVLDVDLPQSQNMPDTIRIRVEGILWSAGHNALDITVVNSTSNYHVYVPKLELDWFEYVRLLYLFHDKKLVEKNYILASMNRGQTLVRPPHVTKA